MRRTISRSRLVSCARGSSPPWPAASAATRRSRPAATRGEQIASPRATLSMTVTRSSIDASRATYPATPASAHPSTSSSSSTTPSAITRLRGARSRMTRTTPRLSGMAISTRMTSACRSGSAASASSPRAAVATTHSPASRPRTWASPSRYRRVSATIATRIIACDRPRGGE